MQTNATPATTSAVTDVGSWKHAARQTERSAAVGLTAVHPAPTQEVWLSLQTGIEVL